MGGRRIFNIALSGGLCGVCAYIVTLLPIPKILALALSVIAGAAAYGITLALSGEIRDELALLHSLIANRKHKS